MAKELPYFRFTVSEWLNDDISLESYEVKGVFSDICAFYWFKDCSIDLAMLKKRFRDAKDMIDTLLNLDIIKLNKDESITIKFLDEQFDLLSQKRLKRSEAGRKGGLKRSSNAKAMLKQSSSYKDKDNNKDNNKNNKKLYSDEIKNFTHSLFRYFDDILIPDKKDSWYDVIEKCVRIDKLTFQQIEEAVKKGRSDPFWNNNFKSIAKLRKKNKDDVLYSKYFITLNKENYGNETRSGVNRDSDYN